MSWLHPRLLTRKKKLLVSLIAASLPFLALELGFRAYFAYKVGPSVLLYGTPLHRKEIQTARRPPVQNHKTPTSAKEHMATMTEDEWKKTRTVISHSRQLDGYSKYLPNQKRVDFDIETGERFEVTINREGFRGRDFPYRKAPGVVRIVTLGASSTFGYFARDDETYPAFLEQILNEGYSGGASFEVINLGIPHLRVSQILALLLTEAVPLDPDVVTLYTGSNDAGQIFGHSRSLRTVTRRLGTVSIVFGFIDEILESRSLRLSSPERFRDRADVIRTEFVRYVSRIAEECKARGILLVIANQQRNSQSFARPALKGMSYQDEQQTVRTKIRESGKMRTQELKFLTHADLMQDLEAWATANRVPFVDMIDRLDRDRDVMVS